jgi:hypothetical protein
MSTLSVQHQQDSLKELRSSKIDVYFKNITQN